VKKIRLKGNDDKIYREINALSKLSHRFIVRYYTTWIERHKITSSTTVSDDSTSEDEFSDTTHTNPRRLHNDLTQHGRAGNSSGECLPVNGGGLRYDFGFGSKEGRRELSSSFPSIHFGASKDEGRTRRRAEARGSGDDSGSGSSAGSGSAGSDEDGDIGFGDLFGGGSGSGGGGNMIGDMALQPPSITPPVQQVTSTLYIQMVGSCSVEICAG
jgi:hypothetical protein